MGLENSSVGGLLNHYMGMVIGIPDLEFPIPSPVLELELQLQFRFFGMGGFHLAIGREASGKKILGGLCVVMMTS